MKLSHLSIPLDFSSRSTRSPGIHISSILSRMAVAQGIYSPQSTINHVKRATGLAWEDWLAPRLADHFPDFEYHSLELCVDDIYMSPDAIHYTESGECVLHEIKLTYYSSRQTQNPEEKLMPWLWQGMAYLYGLSHELNQQCTTCIYHPNFLMGDYARGENAVKPQYHPFSVTFDWIEILTLWRLVLANRHLAEPETNNLQSKSPKEDES